MAQGTQETTHCLAVRSQRPSRPRVALARALAAAWPHLISHIPVVIAFSPLAPSRRDLERENVVLRQALQRLEERMELGFSALEKVWKWPCPFPAG